MCLESFVVADKFDETDRDAVVSELTTRRGVNLSKVGRRRKWFQDAEGWNYWILGGYGEWHGIPEEMMEAELEAAEPGFLVIATRRKADIEIFVGSLKPLTNNRKKLSRAAKTTDDYQFTFTKHGSHLIIDQLRDVRDATLEGIGRFHFGEFEKAKKQIEDLGLSAEERIKLLKSLLDDV